jgi:hypothetical protein
MVKLLEGKPIEYDADVPNKETQMRRPSKLNTTCPACLETFKVTNDFKFMGKNAQFTSLYAVRDVDNQPYRIYFCPMNHIHPQSGQYVGSTVFATRVHFKKCAYKDEIIEYDTELGYIHYVTCLEPHFKCDQCRKDLAVHKWVCQHLDDAEFLRFVDVVDSPWFETMDRELVDEAVVNDIGAMREWIEKKKLRRQ